MPVPCVYVAVTLSNGSLTVLQFYTQTSSPTLPPGAVWLANGDWTREPTPENIQAELRRAFPPFDTFGRPNPQPVSWHVVPLEALPADRTYRNAWRSDGTHVYHDMPHARTLHLDLVRQARLEKLGELDRAWMRATGQGDVEAAAAVEAERQVLRDLPVTLAVDTANTIEELSALWPKELPQ
jgi:hypothetical protein